MALANASDLTGHVIGMQKGNQEDFEHIYSAYRNYAYFTVKKFGGNDNDAEDIVQEAFALVYKNREQLASPEAFRGWFTQILRNCTRKAYKKSEPLVLADKPDDLLEAVPDSAEDLQPESIFESAERRKAVTEAINRLPDRQKTVLYAFYFQDMKIKDIAISQQISENAVKNALYHARLSLEKILEAGGLVLALFLPVVYILRLLLWIQGRCLPDQRSVRKC